MGTPETQAYCDDVQCIGGLCEFHRKSAVGIGQGGTGNSGTDAQVVKFGLMQALIHVGSRDTSVARRPYKGRSRCEKVLVGWLDGKHPTERRNT